MKSITKINNYSLKCINLRNFFPKKYKPKGWPKKDNWTMPRPEREPSRLPNKITLSITNLAY